MIMIRLVIYHIINYHGALYGGGPISWQSKKQSTTALSSTEAEYMALAACICEALWFKKLFEILGISLTKVKIYEDNSGCMNLSTNDSMHGRTKHIDIK